jgi:hypothetical protein
VHTGNITECPAGEILVGGQDNPGTNGTVTFTSTGQTDADGGTLYAFTSSQFLINDVFVKGGNGYVQYHYANGVGSDSLLTTPNNAGQGQHSGLSHWLICSGGGVLAAQMRSVTARLSGRTVNVRWQTASEIDVAGYNVYGVVNGHRTKLNARIIASKGSNGHKYSFAYRVPRGKQAPSRILLQVVNLDGSRQFRSARVAS